MPEYIEREAVLSEVDNAFKMFQEHDDIIELYSDVRAAIIYAKTADVAPVRHGHWIVRHKGMNNWVDCSECGTVGSPHWKCCPVCEVKMDGDADG